VAAIAFVAGMLVQCTGGGQDCIPGEEGCECVFAECVGDLVCQSAICIDLTPGDDDTGATDGDPTTGASNPGTDPTAGTNPTASTDPTAGTNPTASTDPTASSDPTGATDDGGDTTSVTGATTSDPGVCGDGKVDAGEACDDGNNVDGDGCTNDCQPGGGAPVLVFEDAMPTKVLGKGMVPFSEKCSGALRGVGGYAIADGYIGQIEGACADAALVLQGGDYVLQLTNGAALPAHGDPAGMAASVHCPQGQVMTGIRGYADTYGLSGVEPQCSSLTVDPNSLAVVIKAMGMQPLFGGPGDGAVGDAVCPAGKVAIGLLGFLYSDNSVIGLGLHCATPVVKS
jgi:cysteine-rich repeat protein